MNKFNYVITRIWVMSWEKHYKKKKKKNLVNCKKLLHINEYRYYTFD